MPEAGWPGTKPWCQTTAPAPFVGREGAEDLGDATPNVSEQGFLAIATGPNQAPTQAPNRGIAQTGDPYGV